MSKTASLSASAAKREEAHTLTAVHSKKKAEKLKSENPEGATSIMPPLVERYIKYRKNDPL
ncbi:MAG TPA: hypothetical protein VKR32_02200 [Puia sp.]|nr:hypothetical protein [Puia sp.]